MSVNTFHMVTSGISAAISGPITGALGEVFTPPLEDETFGFTGVQVAGLLLGVGLLAGAVFANNRGRLLSGIGHGLFISSATGVGVGVSRMLVPPN